MKLKKLKMNENSQFSILNYKLFRTFAPLYGPVA